MSLEQYNKNKQLIKNIVNEKTPLLINIMNGNNKIIGSLKPITISTINDNVIIERLTKWRNNAMEFFLTQFNATHKRTKIWISNQVLNDTKRLLFIIYDDADNAIGNLGFKGLREYSCEMDNLIRGETGGESNLIYYAEVALIKWIFSYLKIEKITSNLFADNIMSWFLHKRIGFVIKEKIPLFKENINNEIHWEKTKYGEKSIENKYLFHIVLTPSTFLKNK